MSDLILGLLGILVVGWLGYTLITHFLGGFLSTVSSLLNSMFEPVESLLGLKTPPEVVEDPRKPLPNLKEYCEFYFEKHLIEEIPEEYRSTTQEFIDFITSNSRCFHPEQGDLRFTSNPNPWLESFCSSLSRYLNRIKSNQKDVFLDLQGSELSPIYTANSLLYVLAESSHYGLSSSFKSHETGSDPSYWLLNKVAVAMNSKYKLKTIDDKTHGSVLSSLAQNLVLHDYESFGDENAKKVDPQEFINLMLGGTGLLPLTLLRPKKSIPQDVRNAHMYVLGESNSGKTTLLSNLLMKDFQAVADNKCSVILMDSKRDLIKSIDNRAMFAKGGILEGRLVLIDVEDMAYGFTPSLNIMDMRANEELVDQLAMKTYKNNVRFMMNYLFESLLGSGAELTSRQTTIFNYLITLLSEIPGANLETLHEVLESKDLSEYSEELSRLPERSQKYFADTFFKDSETTRRKREIVSRIQNIESRETIFPLFQGSKTKIDFFKEIGEGKIILINCARSVLGPDVEIFGRFMLAMILLAAERRQLVDKDDRKPTYFYIDEASEIISRDTEIARLLTTTRAYNVGMVIAHQNLGQIKRDEVAKTLIGGTAIKCTGNLGESDARRMSVGMEADVKTLTHPSKFSFNVHCTGVGAGTYTPANFSFDSMPKMSDLEYQDFLNENRRKYCISPDYAPIEEHTDDEAALKVAEPDDTTKSDEKPIIRRTDGDNEEDDGTELNF